MFRNRLCWCISIIDNDIGYGYGYARNRIVSQLHSKHTISHLYFPALHVFLFSFSFSLSFHIILSPSRFSPYLHRVNFIFVPWLCIYKKHEEFQFTTKIHPKLKARRLTFYLQMIDTFNRDKIITIHYFVTKTL